MALRFDRCLAALAMLLVGCGASPTSPPAPQLPNDPIANVVAVADTEPVSTVAGPYPVVLVHGFFGWQQIGPLGYFHGVQQDLASIGENVFVAELDPLNSTLVRGEQLKTFVDTVLLQTGAPRVNLIGHSQGGLDARYVASLWPEKVASVLSISTPHQGAHIADVLLNQAPGFTVSLANAFASAIGVPVFGDVAEQSDLEQAMIFLSKSSIAGFNTVFVDRPGVRYLSIGGRSNLALAANACKAAAPPTFVVELADDRDVIEPLLALQAAILLGDPFDPEHNDGVIRVASMKWGEWLGCVPADHFDQIGQIAGDDPGLGNGFDHRKFYRDLIALLRSRGL